MEDYYLITFENSSSAIQTEKQLKNKSLDVAVMPTPTYITQSCGISIRISKNEGEEVEKLLKTKELKFKNYYKKEANKLMKIL